LKVIEDFLSLILNIQIQYHHIKTSTKPTSSFVKEENV